VSAELFLRFLRLVLKSFAFFSGILYFLSAKTQRGRAATKRHHADQKLTLIIPYAFLIRV